MKKVVTFGELILRITPPGREMILQTPNMVCTFGGAEATKEAVARIVALLAKA